MAYYELQQRAYANKLRRNFNVSDVGKEIVLMAEELGELCDGHIKEKSAELVDGIGDLMVYCLGLSAMFEWNADEIFNSEVQFKKHPQAVENYLPYLGREIGMLAKTYKKSNKQQVEGLDHREQFKTHLGNLMGFCSKLLDFMKVDEWPVLEGIISANETRIHQGKI